MTPFVVACVASAAWMVPLERGGVRDVLRAQANEEQAARLQTEFTKAIKLIDNGKALSGQAGQTADAIRDLSNASDILERLAGVLPNNDNIKKQWLVAQTYLGDVLFASKGAEAAREPYERALSTVEDLVARDPDNLVLKDVLAGTRHNLGEVALQQGNLKESREYFRGSLRAREEVIQAKPDNPEPLRVQARTRVRLGRTFAQEGLFNESVAHYRLAIDECKKAARMSPDPNEREGLVVALVSLVDAFNRAKRFDESVPVALEALRSRERIRNANADDATDVYHSATTRWMLSEAYAGNQKPLAALVHGRQAINEVDGLLKEHPDNVGMWRVLGMMQDKLCDVLIFLQRYEEALDLSETALRTRVEMSRLDSVSPQHVLELHRSQLNLAQTLVLVGRYDEGVRRLEDLKLPLQKRLSESPDDHQAMRLLAMTDFRLGEILCQIGRYPAAIKSFSAAKQRNTDYRASTPPEPLDSDFEAKCDRESETCRTIQTYTGNVSRLEQLSVGDRTVAWFTRARAFTRQGRLSDGVVAANHLADLMPRSATSQVLAARALCFCAKTIQTPPKMTAEGTPLRGKAPPLPDPKTLLDRGMECLRESARLDPGMVAKLLSEPDLIPLREREDFRELLKLLGVELESEETLVD
jgi:tetratricopeptide (TPR) repeat protein